MSFVQLHLLTYYHPSNLNRDDLGRPKTAVVGGESRLRISSQSLKRAWRTSAVFKEHLENNIGKRTKRIGAQVFENLKQGGLDDKKAAEYTNAMAGLFGKVDNDKKTSSEDGPITAPKTEQLVHFSQAEKQAIEQFTEKIIAEKPHASDISSGSPGKAGKMGKGLQSLLEKESTTAVDIALFGRMMASSPEYNIEAAAQVAHAVTTHKVSVEDDFFTAVDDLKDASEGDDAGAGHLGVNEFGAGLFYLYICINKGEKNNPQKGSLLANLNNNEELANQTIDSLIRCATTVAPEGKQNSFASRSRASYVRCEVGPQQPRALSVAFLKAIDKAHRNNTSDFLPASIEALEQTAQKIDSCYGKCYDTFSVMNTHTGQGTLDEVIQCATGSPRAHNG